MAVRDSIVAGAQRWLGTPYVWGGESEEEGGVDCSGLVINAYQAAGRPLGGRPIASDIGRMGTQVSTAEAKPGDVVYFDNPGPTDHVGIYIGGGKMIDAPYEGTNVRVDNIGSPTSIRRLLTSEEGGGAGSDPGMYIPVPFIPGGVWTGDVVEDSLDKTLDAINPLDDWADDAYKIGLQIAAALAAGALVVVGVYRTVSA